MNAAMAPSREQLEKMTNDQLLQELIDASVSSCEMAGYGETIVALRDEIKRRLDAG